MGGGLSVASIGDQMFSVVRSWVAAAVFGTASGYLNAAQSVGMLAVALLSGAWADRVEHRRMMIGADLLRLAALLLVAASWALAGTPVGWALFLGVFLMAVGMGLYRPAMQTVLPGIVATAEELPAANALIDTTDRLSRLIGPAIIGAASVLAPLWAFVGAAGLGFAASAAAIGGPMHDIAVATLRQLAVPGREMGSTVRAFMLLNHLGALIAMLMAPTILDAIGVAATTILCGTTICAVAALGIMRFWRS